MARKRGKVQGDNTFGAVHQLDWNWIAVQQPCVKDLWIDCWRAEKFGDGFARLETNVSKNSWTKAKAALSHLFEFRPLCSQTSAGRIQIDGWEVRNLHGSRTGFLSQQMGEEAEVTEEIEEACSSPNKWESKTEVMGDVSQQMGEQNAVGFDTTGFDSCTISNNNLSSIYNENPSSLSRSGRLELDPFTKVTGSAPSPDAYMKSLNKENPELVEDHWSTELNPLRNTEPHCDSSKSTDVSTGLEGYLRSQEDKYPVGDVGIGEVNKIGGDFASNRDETRQLATPHVTLPPESPASAFEHPHVQSNTKLPEPTLQPRVKLTEDERRRIYLGVKDKLAIDGLLVGKCYTYLERFDFALKMEQLHPLSDWFTQENREMTAAMQDDLVTEYLLCDRDNVAQSFICKHNLDGTLTLEFWSEL